MSVKNNTTPWSYGEIALLEGVLLLLLWLWNDYAAALITLIGSLIVLASLLLALVSEWIEPSRVPKRYFWIGLLLVCVSVAVGLAYIGLSGGRLDFLDGKL